MKRKLIVFMKAPVPGRVKTRLCPPLSAAQAALLYQGFARDTIAFVRKEMREPELEVSYAAAPGFSDLRWLDPRKAPAFFAQRGPDLGRRLMQAFARGFSSADRVVALGSDTPHLKPETLGRAFSALERADVVLGPASDGGYYLIGMSRLSKELFAGIRWSSPVVLAQTLKRAAKAKLSVRLLEKTFDVDTPADLRRLRGCRAVMGHTRPLLATVRPI